jgi:hypothetical protein
MARPSTARSPHSSRCPFRLEKGRYYTVTATLEPGAAFSAEAQARGVHFIVHYGRDYTIYHPGIVGPGGVIGGNAQERKLEATYGKPMDVELELQLADLAVADYVHPAVLGKGGVTLQVYSRPITKHDEDDDLRAEQARVAGWNQERTDMKAHICDRCLQDYKMCRVSGSSLFFCVNA